MESLLPQLRIADIPSRFDDLLLQDLVHPALVRNLFHVDPVVESEDPVDQKVQTIRTTPPSNPAATTFFSIVPS